MSSLIYDYRDIRSRMLGDLKPKPEPKPKPLCPKCHDSGWVISVVPRAPVGFITCNACFNPKGLPSP
jgi:hypothetical protein